MVPTHAAGRVMQGQSGVFAHGVARTVIARHALSGKRDEIDDAAVAGLLQMRQGELDKLQRPLHIDRPETIEIRLVAILDARALI